MILIRLFHFTKKNMLSVFYGIVGYFVVCSLHLFFLFFFIFNDCTNHLWNTFIQKKEKLNRWAMHHICSSNVLMKYILVDEISIMASICCDSWFRQKCKISLFRDPYLKCTWEKGFYWKIVSFEKSFHFFYSLKPSNPISRTYGDD